MRADFCLSMERLLGFQVVDEAEIIAELGRSPHYCTLLLNQRRRSFRVKAKLIGAIAKRQTKRDKLT